MNGIDRVLLAILKKRNPELLADTLQSASEGDASSHRPIAVSQVWSHSTDEGEEWLYLRRSTPDEGIEPKTQEIRNPAPGTLCRLEGVGAFDVTFKYP